MNFNVIEGEADFSDIYEDFKRDFLNPYLYRKELMRKYRLSENSYSKIRKQVVAETGITTKPNKYHPAIPTETSYIHKAKSKWQICKYINRKKNFFGTYENLHVAMLIRDELIKCNWDKSQLASIQNKVFGKLRDEYFKNLENIWSFLNQFHRKFNLPDKINFEVPNTGSRANMIVVTVTDIERFEDALKAWLDVEDEFKNDLKIKRVDVERKESLNNYYHQYDISFVYSSNVNEIFEVKYEQHREELEKIFT